MDATRELTPERHQAAAKRKWEYNTMKNGLWAEEVDEPTAQRVADIVGTSSAAGRALRQLAERRLAGEDVVLLKSGRMFFVAPRTQVSNVTKFEKRAND